MLRKRVVSGVDRFGNEKFKYVDEVVPVPVSVQQGTSVEEFDGKYVNRINTDWIIFSKPGHLLDMIGAGDQINIQGWSTPATIEGAPVHYRSPVPHSEVKIRIVEG
ncbi:hypothetical protein ACL1IL_01285 [Corynebacterium striatum]